LIVFSASERGVAFSTLCEIFPFRARTSRFRAKISR
jgi:hypothetical protein